MSENNTTRRSFIRMTALGGMALAIPEVVSAVIGNKIKGRIAINKNDVILFQGDSITDAGRKRDELSSNSAMALGSGYSFLAASELLCRHTDKNFKIYNRGISGDKVPDLAARWERDCLSLKPTILSVHIGVNDYWHSKMRGYKGTVQSYERDYMALLDSALNNNPGLRLIIGEPFGVAGLKGKYEQKDPVFKEFHKSCSCYC